MPAKKLSEIQPRKYVKVELWGPPKSWKTTWAFTAPTPIHYYAWDAGYDLVISAMDRLVASGVIDLPDWEQRKEQIYVYEYPVTRWAEVSPEEALREMEQLMAQFARDFQEAVDAGQKGVGGSIVVDGGTQLHQYWNWRVDAEMERWRAMRIFGSPWSKRNRFFKAILDLAKGAGRHLIMIHHDQEKWEDGKPTGEYEAQGDRLVQRDVDLIVQSVKREERQPERDEKGSIRLGPDRKPVIRRTVTVGLLVHEFRSNPEWRGKEVPWMPFESFLGLIRG